MPAPSLGLTSGIRAGGDRLYEIVRQQAARQIAAEKYAEELRQKRHAELISEGTLETSQFDARTRRGGEARQLAELQWKLDNPEMVEHKDLVDPTTRKPYVELRPKFGKGPGQRLGDQYVAPHYIELNDQIDPKKGVMTRVIDANTPDKPIYESPQYVRPVVGRGGGAAGQGDQDVTGLAQMVIGNPDLLKEMNPTARTAVLREIAKHPEPFRVGRQRLLDNLLGETEETLTELIDHPGLRGAVGAPALTSPGSWPRMAGLQAVPGSPEAGFSTSAQRLQSLLTAPRLDLMRGLGAMSEREFEAMQKSASKLSERLSESEYRDELNRLLLATQAARARGSFGQAGPALPRITPGAPGAAPGAAPAAPKPDMSQFRKAFRY